jgi:hypothetical protein
LTIQQVITGRALVPIEIELFIVCGRYGRPLATEAAGQHCNPRRSASAVHDRAVTSGSQSMQLHLYTRGSSPFGDCVDPKMFVTGAQIKEGA